jgi:hypothetical protein
MIVSMDTATIKRRQEREVQRHVTALCRRGDFTAEALDALAEGYRSSGKVYARRHAKRLAALFRAGLLKPMSVGRGDWDAALYLAKKAWVNDLGHRVFRGDEAPRCEAPKKQRPSCGIVCENGRPCRAKVMKGGAACLLHQKKIEEALASNE